MIKRIIHAILITMLCVSLASCGNSQQTAGEQQAAGKQQTGSKDVFSNLPSSVTCVVQISINPEFEVHVNNDGVIEDIICLNDEAQAICSKLNITGKDYKAGVMELLTTAYHQGYITQDSRVKLVAVRKSTAQYDISSAADEIISDFTANVLDIGFDVQNETVTAENNTDKPDSIIDENGNQVLYTYHDNGQRASVELIRPDGSSRKSFYDKDGVIYEEHVVNSGDSGVIKYENGVIISEEITQADGTHVLTTFGKNGLPISQEETQADGAHGLTTFGGNGLPILCDIKNADGSTHKINYDSNGIAISAEGTYPDGSWSETTYKEGKPYIETRYGLTPEGHTLKIIFHPNGHQAEVVDYYAHNGQEVIYRYDENGTMTEWLHYDNYGCRIHTVYHADGTSVSVRTNEDGSTTTLGN